MDIKYTIEILTKDIQDIEKLVGMLQNSKDASAIELDLAMSKLRNVYEILTMIKADKLNDLVNKSLNGSQESDNEVNLEPTITAESETEFEVEAEVEDVTEPVPEPEAKAEPVPEPELEPEAIPDPVPDPVPDPTGSSDTGETILAEKFQAESSINENLAEGRNEPLDAKLVGQAIDNIARNIGINDKFLIIRELFDNNSEDFSSLISRLDNAENYQSASHILESHFSDSVEHEGVEILSGLVKRRYLR